MTEKTQAGKTAKDTEAVNPSSVKNITPHQVELEKKRVEESDKVLTPVSVKAKSVDTSDIVVEDTEIYRPKELPLVIKPKDGKWKNEEQEEYSRTLNAYAYKNPDKWNNNRLSAEGIEIPNSSKKAVLIKRLAEIGENPMALYKYKDKSKKLKFNNKLMDVK